MIIDFTKFPDGLAPAIVQDASTNVVLMLGYMNLEALAKTQILQRVTFFSRSRQRLWTKGEESGNYLLLKEIRSDCDNDTLLIKAIPQGPVCHTGKNTCWAEKNTLPGFLPKLEAVITDRKKNYTDKSYISSLFASGINKIAQKVGEEAIEVVIEAKDENEELFKNEAADLLFHYLILLQAKGLKLSDVENTLIKRFK